MATEAAKSMSRTNSAEMEAVPTFDAAPGQEEARAAEIMEAPLRQMDWLALNELARIRPNAVAPLWQRLQDEVRDELDSGNLAANALDVVHSPLDRARFLSVREAFNEDLQPRGAVERALVDTLVHAYLDELAWIRGYHVRNELRSEEIETSRGAIRQSPTMDEAAARAEAVEFVERFNRLFVRTLRALDEHRRRSPVVVHHAAQVNVAEQQVNVSAGPRARPPP